jgi:hypothetical protein
MPTKEKVAHTPTPWKVEPLLTPEYDDDPMGVYVIEPASELLAKRYAAADPESEELDAVHAENRAIAAHIERCVNERGQLLEALRDARAALTYANLQMSEFLTAGERIAITDTRVKIDNALRTASE